MNHINPLFPAAPTAMPHAQTLEALRLFSSGGIVLQPQGKSIAITLRPVFRSRPDVLIHEQEGNRITLYRKMVRTLQWQPARRRVSWSPRAVLERLIIRITGGEA